MEIKLIKPWLAALLLLALVVSRGVNGVIQCNDAVAKLVPCETYLLGSDSTPNSNCCGSVQALDKLAVASKPDRKAICRCFKETAKSFPVNVAKAEQLPKLCKVNINLSIGPNVDCDRV